MRQVLLAAVWAGVFTGCATLDPNYEMPSVTVSTVRAVPVPGGIPNFDIGLRVLNPNATPLQLRGVSFTISIEGQKLVRGVGNQLPVIEPYGAGEFNVTASANVLAGIRLANQMLRSQNNSVAYELKAKLDVGAWRPAIRFTDAGQIDLTPRTSE